MSQFIFVAGKQDFTWAESEAAARAQGGLLVSVNTAEEDTFIRGVLDRYDNLWAAEPRDNARNGPWIGLSQVPGSSEPEGGWTWADGTALDLDGWHPSQPDNFLPDSYGLYWDYQGSVGWADHTNDPVGSGYGAVTSYVVELADRSRMLLGSRWDDIVYGGDADNIVRGRGGRDVLDGGGGVDRLDGGAGADRYVFSSTLEADGDRILSLDGNDRIDLSAIDANEARDGNQKFRQAEVFTGRAGELVIAFAAGRSTLAGDTDGDGVADFTIVVAGDLRGFDGFVF